LVNKASENITFTFITPKREVKFKYILYFGFIILTLLSQILYDFWVITGTMLSITIFIIVSIETDIRLFTPMEIHFFKESIILKYPLNRTVEKNWKDIQWLNLWPGDHHCPAYSGFMFNDGKLRTYELSYEAGCKMKEMYQSIIGKKPLNYEEFLMKTNSVRWLTLGPSE